MDLDKKVVEALIADRIGIEGAEAAYAELKDQICAVASTPNSSASVSAVKTHCRY